MKLDFDLNDYVEKIRKSKEGSYFHTFINRSGMAVGLLVLKPGEHDTQEPHDTDEVYYIMSGDGYLKINGQDHVVSRDKVFFVAKNTKHFFHGNKKEMRVLYFFGGSDAD